MKQKLLSTFIFLIAAAMIWAMPGNSSPTPSKGSLMVKDALDRYWNYITENDVFQRVKAGLKVEQLPGSSFEASSARTKQIREILDKLRTININDISYDESLSLHILDWVLSNEVEAHRYFWFQCPIAIYSSPIPNTNRFYSTFEFKEKEDLDRYLHLLDQYPAFIRQVAGVLKEQYLREIILPKPALKNSVDYLQMLIQPAEISFLYVKANRLKAQSIKPKETAAFQKKVARIIRSAVNPELEKLMVFVKGDYSRKAPQRVGLWQYPGGKDYYRSLVKARTSLPITPEEIHQIGLDQITILNKELDKLRKEVKFAGDLESFRRFLKSDPRFIPKSPEEVGKRMMDFKKKVEAQLPLLFNRLPKAPCGVKRLNPMLEASMTYGYYFPPMGSERKGLYMYNASNLEKKNILNAASAPLVLHELLPGHHFQGSLQSENSKLPPFRRAFYTTPYGEGWGEYSAFLGKEMGIYKDPYDRCSLVMEDLFMAVRLVVDTGMNYYGWSRERAMKFMSQYLLIPEVEIKSETLRYSTGIPAQALAYKIGNLKIQELRKKAELALGPKFDIKDFHDAVLNSGSLPLFLLEKHIQRFIEKRR
ncbi:MAG: DUF885 domain-containing protein [bacterium]|nr:DUF885 domain-containing protein [bacterium]